MKIKFRRRKCDVSRYERALRVRDGLAFGILKDEVQKSIDEFETESKIIDFFCSNTSTIEEENKSAKDGKIYKLPIRVIGKNEKKHFVTDGFLICQLIGENYADKRLNVGADYHCLHVRAKTKEIDYWYRSYNEFLLFQLENQDKLDELCKELDIMEENYFGI